MDAVILAGGSADPELAALAGVQAKAQIPYGGMTLLERAVKAIAPHASITAVAHKAPEGVALAEPGETFVQSLTSGLAGGTAERVIISTADMPFITPEAVQGLVEAANPAAGLSYCIVPAEACERIAPKMPRTTLRLKEGEFTGGNAVIVRRKEFTDLLPMIDEAFEARKSPIRLAGIVGMGLLLRVICTRIAPSLVPISSLENVVSKRLGFPVEGLALDLPELAVDIDKAEHLAALPG